MPGRVGAGVGPSSIYYCQWIVLPLHPAAPSPPLISV